MSCQAQKHFWAMRRLHLKIEDILEAELSGRRGDHFAQGHAALTHAECVEGGEKGIMARNHRETMQHREPQSR